MGRIQNLASALIAGMGIFLVFYLYKAFGQLIPFSLSQPELWEQHWLVEAPVVIPMWLRLAYFAVWAVSILATACMLLAAMYLMNLFRKGTYFELRTIKALQGVGACAAVAGLMIIVASSLWGWMVTYQNEHTRRPIALAYDSSEAGIMLLGAGIFLMGWVLKSAVLMQAENEEFV